MKLALVPVLFFLTSLVSAQAIQINLKTMTYHDAFEFASAQLAGGRELSPADLAQLSLMVQKLRDEGDTALAQKTELLVAADQLQVQRALELRNSGIGEIWSNEEKAQTQKQAQGLWKSVRDWSLGLSLASAAGSFFFLWQTNYASSQSSAPYYQRLEDNSKLGAGICVSAFAIFFVALFDAQNQL
jgi:hypothetical protein